MSSPRIEIDLGAIEDNARKLAKLYGSRGISITGVTKGVCGQPEVVWAMSRGGLCSFGDSRLHNIARMRSAGIPGQYWLIRPPRLSEIDRVIELADVSLNTEPYIMCRLAERATQTGRLHRVILMIELGDLREGILPGDVDEVMEQILQLEGIKVVGIGTNLACLSGVKPTQEKMDALSAVAQRARHKYGIDLQFVSGGNSANHDWATSTPDVGLVNHLRIGEAILLGRETARRDIIPGLASRAFTLVAEVIELKTKPSRPFGEIGQDALGRVPQFVDVGPMRRAIVALGEQDVDVSSLEPLSDATILGACSDDLVLHVRDTKVRVGSEIRFAVGYSALLRAMTSPYVHKEYLGTPVERPPVHCQAARYQVAEFVSHTPRRRHRQSPTAPTCVQVP